MPRAHFATLELVSLGLMIAGAVVPTQAQESETFSQAEQQEKMINVGVRSASFGIEYIDVTQNRNANNVRTITINQRFDGIGGPSTSILDTIDDDIVELLSAERVGEDGPFVITYLRRFGPFETEPVERTINFATGTSVARVIDPTQQGITTQPLIAQTNLNDPNFRIIVSTSEIRDFPPPPNFLDVGTMRVVIPDATDSSGQTGPATAFPREVGAGANNPFGNIASHFDGRGIFWLSGALIANGAPSIEVYNYSVDGDAVVPGTEISLQMNLNDSVSGASALAPTTAEFTAAVVTLNSRTGVIAFRLNPDTGESEQIFNPVELDQVPASLFGNVTPLKFEARPDGGGIYAWSEENPIFSNIDHRVQLSDPTGAPLHAPQSVNPQGTDVVDPSARANLDGDLSFEGRVFTVDGTDVMASFARGLGSETSADTVYANPELGIQPSFIIETDGDAGVRLIRNPDDPGDIEREYRAVGDARAATIETFDSFKALAQVSGASDPGDFQGLEFDLSLDLTPVELVLDNDTRLSISFTQTISSPEDQFETFTLDWVKEFDVNLLEAGVEHHLNASLQVSAEDLPDDWIALEDAIGDAYNADLVRTNNRLLIELVNFITPGQPILDPLVRIDDVQIDMSIRREVIPTPGTLPMSLGLMYLAAYRRPRRAE